MKFGEQWHCMNPACHCEIRVITSGAVEGLHPRCTCGSMMKKEYSRPALSRDTDPQSGLLRESAGLAQTMISIPFEQPVLANRASVKD